MMHYLNDAKYVEGFRFWVRFNTGEEGEVDLADILRNAPKPFGEIFAAESSAVKEFYLDPWPTLAWKCGYDIAPETLYDLFVSQRMTYMAVGVAN
jgi:hypothetical protein